MPASTAHRADPKQEFAVRVARNIDVLLKWRGMRPPEASLAIGMPHSTWYRRMRDGQWTGQQLEQLADTFKVEVSMIYSDPDELIRSRYFSAADLASSAAQPAPLVVIDGGGERSPGLPRRRARLVGVRSA